MTIFLRILIMIVAISPIWATILALYLWSEKDEYYFSTVLGFIATHILLVDIFVLGAGGPQESLRVLQTMFTFPIAWYWIVAGIAMVIYIAYKLVEEEKPSYIEAWGALFTTIITGGVLVGFGFLVWQFLVFIWGFASMIVKGG